MKTPIEYTDIRKGDLIRVEYDNGDERAYEFRVTGSHMFSHAANVRRYLLDRPKKVLYAKGTHLWLTEDLYPSKKRKDEELVLCEDWYEGDDGRVTGLFDKVPPEFVTPVKPDPYAEPGLVRWVKQDCDSHSGIGVREGAEVRTTGVRHSHSKDYAGVSLSNGAIRFIREDMLTDVEPPPAVVVPDLSIPYEAIDRVLQEHFDRFAGKSHHCGDDDGHDPICRLVNAAWRAGWRP